MVLLVLLGVGMEEVVVGCDILRCVVLENWKMNIGTLWAGDKLDFLSRHDKRGLLFLNI
jgi:hypothetical protein